MYCFFLPFANCSTLGQNKTKKASFVFSGSSPIYSVGYFMDVYIKCVIIRDRSSVAVAYWLELFF